MHHSSPPRALHTLPISSSLTSSFKLHLSKIENHEAPHVIFSNLLLIYPSSVNTRNFKIVEIISSTLKMEAIYSPETSVATQKTTLRHTPEDDTFYNHRCENLKSYNIVARTATI
jgi:hypothetical protein